MHRRYPSVGCQVGWRELDRDGLTFKKNLFVVRRPRHCTLTRRDEYFRLKVANCNTVKVQSVSLYSLSYTLAFGSSQQTDTLRVAIDRSNARKVTAVPTHNFVALLAQYSCCCYNCNELYYEECDFDSTLRVREPTERENSTSKFYRQVSKHATISYMEFNIIWLGCVPWKKHD